jgi:CheB methylesterase
MAQGNAQSNPFVIAASGASARGLEAREQLFKHMPGEAGIASVIIQHLAPDHAGAVPELRARCTLEKIPAPFKRLQAASIPAAVSAWRFAKNGWSVRGAEFARNLSMGSDRRSTLRSLREAVMQ